MDYPQVSVVMPVYNAERYVAEAVESILAQTLGDFEFLVFDDGSTDRSITILEEYALKDVRLRLFIGEHKGYTPWLNEGIRIASGEFIARMDADDISLPERLAYQVAYLRRQPKYVAVGCNMLIIDPDGRPLIESQQDIQHETIEASLLGGKHGVIGHPTCVMRRSALLAIGGYREKYDTIEDYDLWLRLAEKGRLANIPDVLFKYRLHHANVVYTQVDRQGKYADQIIAEARLRRGLKPLSHTVWGFRAPTVAGRHQLWAWYAAAGGYRKTALRHAFIGLRASPFTLRSWVVLLRCVLPNGVMPFLKQIGLRSIWTNCNSKNSVQDREPRLN